MYARINKKCINEDVLGKILIDFFLPVNDIIIQKDKNCVTYKDVCEGDKVIISFVSEKKPPYNVYDSCICDGEFEYTQLIIFDIKKEEAFIDEYKKNLDFCIYLKGKVEGDILVTSDVHDDICFLEGTEVIWSKDISFDSRK